jgi:regulator of cell morphogenesis and NO signaling
MEADLSNSSGVWGHRTLIQIIDHIVEKHHVFCRQEVLRMGTLFKEINAGYGKDHPELKRIEVLFSGMVKKLLMHLLKEEQTLFPYIARVESAVTQNASISWPPFGTVGNPIRMMVLEHDQANEEIKEIRRLSNGYTPPPGASDTCVALYGALAAFELDMREHIRTEDHLLLPRAISMEEEACAKRKPTVG